MTPRAPLLALLLLSCNGKDETDDSAGPQGWTPDLYCPGDPSGVCDSNEGALSAGAAALSIVPDCFEAFEDLDDDAEWDRDEPFLDCGCDRLCPEDDGYPGPDAGEGDGDFQAIWLAGFQHNRPATGVHDPIWARAVVFDQGDTRVGILVLDVVGLFYDEVLRIREGVDAAGLDVDHLLVLSSHNHEGPDAVGLWGRTETVSGVNPEWMDKVVSQSVEAVRQSVSGLREVGEFKVGHVDASSYSDVGILNVLQDKRDPKVVDVTFSAAILRDTSGDTIATLAHFGNHPESIADENSDITSDYLNALREGLESGVEYDAYTRDGYGGVALYLTGTVGGMMTPLGLTITDGDGVERREYSHERTEALGKVKAEMAMDAIDQGQVVTDARISAARTTFYMPVENWGFQALFLSGVLARETYDWDPAQPVSDENMPKVLTEMDHLAIGPIEMLTIPGELLPELAIGGYDGSAVGTTLQEIVDADNPNPPDLSQAPSGPYLKDMVQSEHTWIIGLANDELGYIVPPYNFILDEVNPWFDEAEGDHYEETNSIGFSAAPTIQEKAEVLLDWVYAQ
ncbi:MAG: hypothetical protein H6739_07385 [Alphaproteobacteria bacterium]|nr:hypothetical protein [Alphaproteobacteria bacterium]